jgi:hypothetical protein
MPLLENEGLGQEEVSHETSALTPTTLAPPPFFSTLWILLVLLGMQLLATKLMNLPLNRVIELRYCQEYYELHDPSLIGDGGNIPEHLCKLDCIQQRLAWMQGTLDILHALCGKSTQHA